jgi:hypothetical protein
MAYEERLKELYEIAKKKKQLGLALEIAERLENLGRMAKTPLGAKLG